MRVVALKLGGLFLLAGALASCIQGGRTGPVDPRTERRLSLIPLVDGKTTREEVVLAYGIPSAQFENERILCYRLMPTEDGIVIVPREADMSHPGATTWWSASMNLILVFDASSVLEKHRLLRIRQTLHETLPDEERGADAAGTKEGNP